MSQVLVCNCGSSSLKLTVFDAQSLTQTARVLVERIGNFPAISVKRPDLENKLELDGDPEDHAQGLNIALAYLREEQLITNVVSVGHRVVHGGPHFSSATALDDDAIAKIDDCIRFAPLHNPANLIGIKLLMETFDVPHAAIFDTAFHATMPDHAYNYALPAELVEKHAIRRYGFHGTSHQYLAEQAAEMLGKPDANIVTLHLGNGASACAIKKGESVDTSMGYTPLEGLVMGTRSGDIDPAIVTQLQQLEGLSPAETETMLNKSSGLHGIAGMSDMRDLLTGYTMGIYEAELAINVFCYRIRKTIGAYAAALGGLDAVVFSAGIGENSSEIRQLATQDLQFLGLEIDATLNQDNATDISAANSRVKTLVIPTNEALMIAKQALASA